MADNTAIEWTDATWNPITGCSVVSPGCTNCYAMKLAGGRLQHHPTRAGLTTPSKAGPVWNGQVRLNADQLTQPLRWKRPRRIFVCAHGDLFHESVPDAWIDQVFAAMALSPQHTYQVLTKRPERMQPYMVRLSRFWILRLSAAIVDLGDVAAKAADAPGRDTPRWPLPNVWLGVSAEDQARADERIPHLLATPAAVRFLSAEPLLGAIDLEPWLCNFCKGAGWVDDENWEPAWYGQERERRAGRIPCGICNLANWAAADQPSLGRLDWVIAGGESGPGARPMHPDWARQIRDACAASRVPFFFKQWGAWHPTATPPSEIQEDLELQNAGQMLDGQYLTLIGKKAAGRVLDYAEHSAMPARP